MANVDKMILHNKASTAGMHMVDAKRKFGDALLKTRLNKNQQNTNEEVNEKFKYKKKRFYL